MQLLVTASDQQQLDNLVTIPLALHPLLHGTFCGDLDFLNSQPLFGAIFPTWTTNLLDPYTVSSIPL
jgi:hypothetical protein